MFVRKYKIELEKELKKWEEWILLHWKSHKKPLWTGYWEDQCSTTTRHYFEMIVAIIWITQGAKGCTCYKNSPILQDRVANYFMTKGAIEACETITLEATKNGNFDTNLPLTKPRKLLI